MRFLAGADLAVAVRKMFATESGLRCAVAFWGPEYAKLARTKDVMAILDVSMGGTSKTTLEAFGVGPKSVSKHARQHLRVLNGLHTKLFLGADRCILGSANASGAALGRAGGQPKLFEAAFELERRDNPAAFDEVEALWQSYLTASREVTLADHQRAPRVAATSAARDRWAETADSLSILQAVLEQPDGFFKTAFAFGDHDIKQRDLDGANAGYEQELEDTPKAHRRTHICSAEISDSIDTAFRSTDYIITFWFGTLPGLYAYHDIVRIEHDDAVSYFGRRSWKYVGAKVGLKHLPQDDAWQTDQKAAFELAKLDDEKKGSRYVALSADALYKVLEQASSS